MDWLLSHEEELDGLLAAEANKEASPAPTTQEDGPSAQSTEATAVAKSIRCDDCGKLFKTQEEVEFHASKSGWYIEQ